MPVKKQTCQQVAKEECADYQDNGPYGERHFCINGEKTCVFFGDFKPCGYWERYVLPVYPDVAAEYADRRGQADIGDVTIFRQAVCRVCGEAFKTTSNRQQYCSQECQRVGNKWTTKDRVKRHRKATILALF